MELVEGLMLRLEKAKSKGKRKSIVDAPNTPPLRIETGNSIVSNDPPESSHDSLFTPQSSPSEFHNIEIVPESSVFKNRVLGDGQQVYNPYWYLSHQY
jgi:hypothetical protein